MDYNLVEKCDYKEHEIKVFYDECADSPRNWDNVATMACWHRGYRKLGDVSTNDYKEPVDYLRYLVRSYVPEKEIVDWAYKNGKEEKDTIRLKYNRSTREWEVLEYLRYGVPGLFMSDPYWDVQHSNPCKDDLAYCIIDDLTDSHCMELLEKYLFILPLSFYEHSAVKLYAGSPCCQWDSGYVGFAYVERKKYAHEKNFEEWAEKCIDAECKIYTQHLNGWVYSFTVTNEEGEVVDSCGGFYDSTDEAVDYAKESIDAMTAA